MKKKLLSLLLPLFFTLCGLTILWCERLQFGSLHAKRIWVEGGSFLIVSFAFFVWVFGRFLPKRLMNLRKAAFSCVVLCSVIAAVCVMVWFPLPQTGVLDKHILVVTNLSVESPMTLTWLKTDLREESLSTFQGRFEKTEAGLTIPPSGCVQWRGVTGKSATVEFAADPQGGEAAFSWDGQVQKIGLNHDELEKISFETAFPPSFGLPEFIAWFALLALLVFSLGVGSLTAEKCPSLKLMFGLFFVCFVLFRLFQFQTAETPLFFVDSESYIGVSEMSLSAMLRGKPFCYPEENLTYCISRPPLIPLLYKLCGQENSVIAWVQFALSLLGWGFFALSSASVLRHPLWKSAAFFTLLGLGSIPNVTRWDLMIMTESLTMALAVSFLGSLLCLTGESDWLSRRAACVLTLVFGFLLLPTRDSSAWIVLMCGVVLLLLNFCKSFSKLMLVSGFGLILFSVLNMLGTDDRWQFPFENVIFARILRDPEATAYFYASGMPHPEGIETLYGEEHLQGSALFNSEEMEPLRNWILSDGLKTYFRYLVRTPIQALRMTWYSGFEREAFEETDYFYTPSGFHCLMPESLVKFFSFNAPGIAVILLGFLGLIRVFCGKKGMVFTIPAVLILSSYLLVSAVLLIDTYDFARHALINIVLIKGSSWMVLWLLLDHRSDQYIDPLLRAES